MEPMYIYATPRQVKEWQQATLNSGNHETDEKQCLGCTCTRENKAQQSLQQCSAEELI